MPNHAEVETDQKPITFDLHRDAVSVRPSFLLSFVRMILIVLHLLGIALQAQPHNGIIYQQLLTDYLEQQGDRFQHIDGPQIESFTPAFVLDSTASTRLSLGFPEVNYTQFDAGKIIRKVALSVQREDSVLRSEMLSYQDTLDQKIVRKIFKESPKSLRGENPSVRARWLLPTLLLGGSIGGIVSLFYVRSRGN